MAKDKAAPGTEIVRKFTEDELLSITSFDDAAALVTSVLGSVYNAANVLGDGFTVMDKATLLDVPFIVLDTKFAQGDFGDMVILRIVTQRNEKGVIVDGSTGIYAQMRRADEKGFGKGLFVNGLTRSDYTYTDDKGESRPAHTFYLNV